LRWVVTYSLDQDPYFRLVRDVTTSLNYPKPVTLIGKFLPALQGEDKMSTTGEMPLIYLQDSPEEVDYKIRKHTFSGGRDTLKEHKEKGTNLDVDIAYQYLRFFESDNKVLEEIGRKYGKGEMSSKEVKDLAILKINEILQHHRTQKSALQE
jgi:tryptophanyl-tRNA synthetase